MMEERKPSGWMAPEWLMPALGQQVVGVCNGELAWWTRTDDGWYVSDHYANLGHRDAMTPDKSLGPDLWAEAPTIALSRDPD
jgi:hypothetical protein